MGTFATACVVLVRFPFSDLSGAKLRPAVVLADVGRDDWILCQITSKPYSDTDAITLDDACFTSGSLRATSFARPGKLFTANGALIATEVGILNSSAFEEVINAVVALLQASLEGISL